VDDKILSYLFVTLLKLFPHAFVFIRTNKTRGSYNNNKKKKQTLNDQYI